MSRVHPAASRRSRAVAITGMALALSVLGVPLLLGRTLHGAGLVQAVLGALAAIGCAALALVASRPGGLTVRTALPAVLAASALNAVTPAALGGTAMTLRLHRRTGLSAEQGAAAIAVRSLAGAVSAAALALLAARYAGIAITRQVPIGGGLVAAIGVALVLAALVASVWAPARATARAGLCWLRACCRAGRAQLRRPGRTALLLGATVGLQVAQLVTLHGALLATGHAPSLGLLLMAQLGANTARSASPLLPGGLGAFEGALIGALHTGGVALGTATLAVLIYRAIGQGLPVAGGIWALGSFRRRGLI